MNLHERTQLSRQRLAASELGGQGRAWRLWNACLAQTLDHGTDSDTTYAKTLAKRAGLSRQFVSTTLRRFDELGIIQWKAAALGTRDASHLALPELNRGRFISPKMNLPTDTTTTDDGPCVDDTHVDSDQGTNCVSEGTSTGAPQDASLIRIASSRTTKTKSDVDEGMRRVREIWKRGQS